MTCERITATIVGLLALYSEPIVQRWAKNRAHVNTFYRARRLAGLPPLRRGRKPGQRPPRKHRFSASEKTVERGLAMHALGWGATSISRALGGSVSAWKYRIKIAETAREER